MKRRMTAWLLALMLTVSLLPVSALADTAEAESRTQTEQMQPSPNGDAKLTDLVNDEPSAANTAEGAADSAAPAGDGSTETENGETPPTSSAVCKRGEIEYGSLQAALDGAAEGDTIVLMKDTIESIKITRAVTLDLSGKTLTAAEGKRVIEVSITQAGSDAKLTIKNGTITGGKAGKQWGGGIYIGAAIYASGTYEKKSVSLPVFLTGLTITENSAQNGGGIYMRSGLVTLSGCTVSGNKVDGGSGGGIYQTSGDYSGPSTICTLIDTTVVSNSASGGGGIALGAASYYSNIPNVGERKTDVTATLILGSGSKIANNEASYQGGGVYLTGNGSRFRMEGGELSDNSARYYGGGLCSMNYCGAAIKSGSITGNKAAYGGGSYIKAGSAKDHPEYNPLSEEQLIIGRGVTIKGNRATVYGGGIFADSYQSAEGVGIEMADACVYDNTAGQAGDDLYNTGVSGSYFHFVPVGTGWKLTACGDEIDGWYDDSKDPEPKKETALQAAADGGRWNAHSENGTLHVQEFTDFKEGEAKLTGLLALKAAHGPVYRVFYDGNGGTGTVTDTKSPYAEGAEVTVLDNGFAYTNYTFTGWNTQKDGKGTAYQAGDTFVIKADTTLYAQWRYTPPYIPPAGPVTPAKPSLNTADHYAYLMGYPDGTVRPNGSITRAEATTIFFRLLTEESRTQFWATENRYSDVAAGQWYNNAISTMTNAGIVDGYPDGTFRPNAPITRAEMAKIIALFAKLDKSTDRFPDTAGHWAEAYIRLAAGNGWIEGYPDGTFRPNQSITRAETVTMIDRVLERVPKDESRLLPHSAMLTFPDCTPGQWFYIAVQEAANSHIYERAASEQHGDEQWKDLRDNRDWTMLEY